MRTKQTTEKTAKLASALKRKPVKAVQTDRIYAHTGSTLLNLATSEDPFGGFVSGRIINIVGDSSSGKSFLAHTILAACNTNPAFNGHRFYRDDAEEADAFDVIKLFGQGLADRIEPPAGTRDEPENSSRIDLFEAYLHRALSEGPCIYVLDSLDALTSKEEEDRTKNNVKAVLKEVDKDDDKESKVKDSYGMEVPKKLSAILRQVESKLAETGSLLIIVSQTRANIDKFSPVKLTRSGGKALEFYSSYILWLTKCEAMRESSHKRVIGVHTEIKVSKNRITGKMRELPMYIFYDYGIDDIRASIEWMVDEGYWTKSKSGGVVHAEELGLNETINQMVHSIEDQGMEDTLADIVGRCWMQIEEDIKLNRKARFA